MPKSKTLKGIYAKYTQICKGVKNRGEEESQQPKQRKLLSILKSQQCCGADSHSFLGECSRPFDSTVHLQEPASSTSAAMSIILIRGRLLQKLPPPYRTPAEFVSDIWLLLDILLKKAKVSIITYTHTHTLSTSIFLSYLLFYTLNSLSLTPFLSLVVLLYQQ